MSVDKPNKADFSFDKRVSRRYDHQRAHPAMVSEQIGAAVMAEVRDGGAVLEIGIGTGRIARPVASAGGTVYGLDISLEMLAEVGQDMPRLHAFRGDMHALPFADNSFSVVMAVHVLHLTADWQAVLREAARVLRPGGALIVGDDVIDPQSVIGRLRDQLRVEAVRAMPEMMPPGAGVRREDVLRDLGATEFYTVEAAAWETRISPAERLRAIDRREDAESWALPSSIRDDVVDAVKAFAAETWDDLEAEQPVGRTFVLQVSRGVWVG